MSDRVSHFFEQMLVGLTREAGNSTHIAYYSRLTGEFEYAKLDYSIGGTMSPYTHTAIGLAAGSYLFPANYLAQFVCTLGSALPDLPGYFKYFADKRRGVQPFTQQSPTFLEIKEFFHSFPLWLFWWFLVWFFFDYYLPPVVTHAFFILGLSHLAIDALTHKEAKYRDTDNSLMWPFTSIRLGDYLAVWEYRLGHGDPRIKPPEIIILLSLLVATAYLQWLYWPGIEKALQFYRSAFLFIPAQAGIYLFINL